MIECMESPARRPVRSRTDHPRLGPAGPGPAGDGAASPRTPRADGSGRHCSRRRCSSAARAASPSRARSDPARPRWATTSSTARRVDAAKLTLAQIEAKVDPALVDITSTLGSTGTAAGTGMVISSTGEILTNNHVIAGATKHLREDRRDRHHVHRDRRRLRRRRRCRGPADPERLGAGNRDDRERVDRFGQRRDRRDRQRARQGRYADLGRRGRRRRRADDHRVRRHRLRPGDAAVTSSRSRPRCSPATPAARPSTRTDASSA